jgi:photosystem II stability/assembly factor-like uncharacterized protein
MISVQVRRIWWAAAVGALIWLTSPPASANGRFPGADQLVVDPSTPDHMLVRTTFGFLETRDGGRSWFWICEESVGRIGTADPPIAITGDGTLFVSVPFEGVALSHDGGCSWSRAPAPLLEQLVVDMTLEPGDPNALLVLTSTNDPTVDSDAGFEFVTRIVETKDNGRTWNVVGAALPRDLIAATIEVAPSDPQRLYVGGVAGDPPAALLETSADRGQSWSRAPVPNALSMANAYVSAIDPRDADRLWVRVHGATDPFGMAPTVLLSTRDRGATWTTAAENVGSMFGFALSPDGSQVAYGTQQDGIFLAPSDAAGPFERVSTIKNRCLTWSRAGLYACGTEPIDPFSVGRSTDGGHTFGALYLFADTCPQACADDSSFGNACRASWTDPTTGVATITRATGRACTVPWAKVGSDDGGGEAAIPDAGSGDARVPALAAGGGCSCAMRRTSGGPLTSIAMAIGVARLWLRRRTRSSRHLLRGRAGSCSPTSRKPS